MKTIAATMLALILTSGLASAGGCEAHGTEASMSCAKGTAWDDKAKACVEISA
ncbi:MAG: hypothetical protein ACO3BE_03725 [Gemmobacter sp.]|jgi:hypothetical protein